MEPLINIINEWKYTRPMLGIAFAIGLALLQFPQNTVAYKIGLILQAVSGSLGAASAGPSKTRSAVEELKKKLEE